MIKNTISIKNTCLEFGLNTFIKRMEKNKKKMKKLNLLKDSLRIFSQNSDRDLKSSTSVVMTLEML